jgi:hypothetical protein
MEVMDEEDVDKVDKEMGMQGVIREMLDDVNNSMLRGLLIVCERFIELHTVVNCILTPNMSIRYNKN